MYDTSTPGGSSVAFSARTSPTNVFMGASTPLATAQATPSNTQVCTAFGPAGCPKDLYTLLTPLNAKQKFLELMITMNPSADQLTAPVVNNWDLTYSCQDAE
jgi:hypothetical protein